MIGRQIGGFEIVAEIGRGGMGVVYRAQQLSLDRAVAFKTLLPALDLDEVLVERFRAEARAASRVNHPNLVQVYDVGFEGGTHYLAMELVEGESLGALIAREGPMDYARAAAVASQIASGLGALHGVGIVHRDLKPSNILVRPDGVIKITDFGVARLREGVSRLTAEGRTVGTAAYMSPEQAQSQELDGRSDIYSAGIVLYQMLTEQLPFTGETPLAVMKRHCDVPPPSVRRERPNIPDRMAEIVEECLAKNPGERYQTAESLAADLDHLRLELEFAALSAETPSLGTASLYSTCAVASLHAEAEASRGLAARLWRRLARCAGSTVAYAVGSLDRDIVALRRAAGQMEDMLGALAETKRKRSELRASADDFRARAEHARRGSADAFDADDVGVVDELAQQEKEYSGRAVDLEAAAEGLSDSIREMEERYRRACAEHERRRTKVQLKQARAMQGTVAGKAARRRRCVKAGIAAGALVAIAVAAYAIFGAMGRARPQSGLPRSGAQTAEKPKPEPRAGIIYVDHEARGPEDGSSWAGAFTGLQEALAVAGKGAEIWVAKGSYKPTDGISRDSSFQMKPEVALYGGFGGTESAREQRDWTENVTVLSGDIGVEGAPGDNCYHVVRGANGATIDGFTITGGRADGSGPDHQRRAGGLYNDGASPRVANCTLADNYALYGGAMQNRLV